MDPQDTASVAEFSDEGFQKITLFESDELFVDIYCFRPGQEQAPHTHVESEKVYHVLEGTATILAGESEHHLTPGEIIHIPKGAAHGVRNETDSVLRTLVMMAPLPDESGGETSHQHGHAHVDTAERSFAVLTVSSTRDVTGDESGGRIIDLLEGANHEVAVYDVVLDDHESIRATVQDALGSVEAVILTGGTGVTPDDVTIEAIRPLLDKELPGFGEHFRRLSVDEVGTAAIMTRTTAGIADETPIFALPGSTAAVDLAVNSIILPEIDHLVDLAAR